MTSEETITLTRREYEALIERNIQLEDMLAAQDADDGVRVPHNVLRELSEKTGVAAGYISEIERGLKPGSTSALARIAGALGTTIDVLVNE